MQLCVITLGPCVISSSKCKHQASKPFAARFTTFLMRNVLLSLLLGGPAYHSTLLAAGRVTFLANGFLSLIFQLFPLPFSALEAVAASRKLDAFFIRTAACSICDGSTSAVTQGATTLSSYMHETWQLLAFFSKKLKLDIEFLVVNFWVSPRCPPFPTFCRWPDFYDLHRHR